ncbi:CRISPR-associated protein Cas4 [Methanococcoides sp. LMO-2]|uniref:Dna2/Cas4 domain-containing protein n=1 Tax=Methanococcoides cohabitans TaxID=3136559 RepID=A0ABU9KUD3_9EURY
MPLINLKLHANVSELILYLKCPRQVYYTHRKHELATEITPEYLEHMMLKELAIGYPDAIERATDESQGIRYELNIEMERVKGELELIYSTELRDLPHKVLETAESVVAEQIEKIATNLSEAISEYGKEEVIRRIRPYRTEPVLHSDKLKLTGIPSAVIQYGEKMIPLSIRTGKCPDSGVWRNDRIHIAAIAMLLEENYGDSVDHGFVQYARHGNIRQVKIRPEDRRQVLKIRTRIDNIKDGTLPERKENPACSYCNFTQFCTSTRSSLASRLF